MKKYIPLILMTFLAFSFKTVEAADPEGKSSAEWVVVKPFSPAFLEEALKSTKDDATTLKVPLELNGHQFIFDGAIFTKAAGRTSIPSFSSVCFDGSTDAECVLRFSYVSIGEMVPLALETRIPKKLIDGYKKYDNSRMASVMVAIADQSTKEPHTDTKTWIKLQIKKAAA